MGRFHLGVGLGQGGSVTNKATLFIVSVITVKCVEPCKCIPIQNSKISPNIFESQIVKKKKWESDKVQGLT